MKLKVRFDTICAIYFASMTVCLIDTRRADVAICISAVATLILTALKEYELRRREEPSFSSESPSTKRGNGG